MLLEQVEQTIITEASFPVIMLAAGENLGELRLDCDMQIRGTITVYVRRVQTTDGSRAWKVTDDCHTVRSLKHAWSEAYDDIADICIRNSVQENNGELYVLIDTAPYTSLCCLLCAIIEIRVRAGLA